MDSRTKRRLNAQQRRQGRHHSTNVFAKLSQEKIQLYKEVFTIVDQDGDGAITKKDLQSLFTSLGVTDVTEETLMEMLTQANGTINFTTFLAMFAHMTSEMDSDETIVNAFSILDDSNGRGQMDALEFQTLMTTVGVERLTQDEMSTIMRQMPVDENGMLDLDGAVKLFTFNDGLN